MSRSVWGLILAAAASAQTAGQPAFEVATIKPAEMPTADALIRGAKLSMGMKVDGARVDIGFMSLADIIRQAYRVKAYQVSGPDWIQSARFDIQAKLPEGASTGQVPEMLQSLLAERFHLALHREHKDHAVYALVVGGGGLKLKEAEPDPVPAEGAGDDRRVTFGPMSSGGAVQMRDGGGGQSAVYSSGGGAIRTTTKGDGTIHFERKMTLPLLADFLSRFVDRPVVDMTEAQGTYEVALDIPMADQLRSGSANVVMRGTANGMPMDQGAMRDAVERMSDGSGASVFSAVQKLGLKLEPRKAPMEMLMIDRVDKAPTEN